MKSVFYWHSFKVCFQGPVLFEFLVLFFLLFLVLTFAGHLFTHLPESSLNPQLPAWLYSFPWGAHWLPGAQPPLYPDTLASRPRSVLQASSVSSPSSVSPGSGGAGQNEDSDSGEMWWVDYAGPGPHFEKGGSSLRATPERDVCFFSFPLSCWLYCSCGGWSSWAMMWVWHAEHRQSNSIEQTWFLTLWRADYLRTSSTWVGNARVAWLTHWSLGSHFSQFNPSE